MQKSKLEEKLKRLQGFQEVKGVKLSAVNFQFSIDLDSTMLELRCIVWDCKKTLFIF